MWKDAELNKNEELIMMERWNECGLCSTEVARVIYGIKLKLYDGIISYFLKKYYFPQNFSDDIVKGVEWYQNMIFIWMDDEKWLRKSGLSGYYMMVN